MQLAKLVVAALMAVLACFLNWTCERLRLELGIMDGIYPVGDSLKSSGRLWTVIGVTVLFLLQPYPFLIGIKVEMYNYSIEDLIFYHVNDFLHLLSFFRIMLALARLFNLSNWISNSSHRVW